MGDKIGLSSFQSACSTNPQVQTDTNCQQEDHRAHPDVDYQEEKHCPQQNTTAVKRLGPRIDVSQPASFLDRLPVVRARMLDHRASVFTKWCNLHFSNAFRHLHSIRVISLTDDIKDGVMVLKLLQVFSGYDFSDALQMSDTEAQQSIKRITSAIDFLGATYIRADDIALGKQKATLA
jgi:hypothetical protein